MSEFPRRLRKSESTEAIWARRRAERQQLRSKQSYVVFAADCCVDLAMRLQASDPSRFDYLPISWNKFADGTDCIKISGFSPENLIAGEHVLFLASFHNNDVTLSQLSVLIVLLQVNFV